MSSEETKIEPEAKKLKTEETMSTPVPESPDEEWPEAWYMLEDGEYEDQKERNRLTPNKPASIAVLKELGIAYWKMDAEKYSYPAKAIPWDPKDATDPKLRAIRDDREYLLYKQRVLFANGMDESFLLKNVYNAAMLTIFVVFNFQCFSRFY